MSNIKLKDLLNEVGLSGVVSRSPWAKNEEKKPQINVKELVNSINNYSSLGENIYGNGNLKQVAETLSKMAEGAAQHTLSETEDMFDKVTVSRNMKELTGLSKQFGKKPDKISNAMMESIKNLREINVINKDHAGTFLRQSYMDNLDDVYEKVAKKYGEKNAAKFKRLGLFGHDELLLGMGELRPNA